MRYLGYLGAAALAISIGSVVATISSEASI
jgi:hypothetical protein